MVVGGIAAEGKMKTEGLGGKKEKREGKTKQKRLKNTSIRV